MTDELTGSEDPRLAEALEYANTLIRLSPDGVLAVDLDLRITEWNLLMEQMCGKSRQQEIGQDLAEIPFMKETAKAPGSGKAWAGRASGPGRSHTASPARTRTDSSSPSWRHCGDPQGTSSAPWCACATSPRASRPTGRSSESEKEYRQLFEDSRDALMVMRPPSWRFTDANPAMLHMFGAASTAEFAALGPWDVSPERQPDGRLSAEKAREMIATALREGSNEFEWESRRVSGELFTSDVLLARMEADGQFFVKGTVRDISERKRAEEHVLTLNRALEEKVQQLLAAQQELEQQRAHLEQEVARRTAGLTEAQRIAHLGNWKWDMATNTVNWSDEDVQHPRLRTAADRRELRDVPERGAFGRPSGGGRQRARCAGAAARIQHRASHPAAGRYAT